MVFEALSFISPREGGIRLSDVKAAELRAEVSDLLGVRYLSPASGDGAELWPVRGVLYGPNHRLLGNLVVKGAKADASPVNVTFLVDTGSPYTHVGNEALEALGYESLTPATTMVSVRT